MSLDLVSSVEFEVTGSQGLAVRSQFSSGTPLLSVDVASALDSFPNVSLQTGDVWVLSVFHKKFHQSSHNGVSTTFFYEVYKWQRLLATEHEEDSGKQVQDLLFKIRNSV